MVINLANKDKTDVVKALESQKSPDVRDTLKNWLKDIESHPFLIRVLGKGMVANFYRLYASYFAGELEYEKAIEYFGKAVELVPEDPESHLMLADAYFAINDFPRG